MGISSMLRGARRRDDRGATAVEFALVMLPLVYLVFGIIQYGLYFYARESGTQAVGDAARRLSVGDCTTDSELKAFIVKRLGNSSTTNATTIVVAVTNKKADGTAATGLQQGGSVQVSATFNAINMNFPFIPLPNNGTITSTVFGRVEDTTATTGGCS